MVIELELSSEDARRLTESRRNHDAAAIREILRRAVDAKVKSLSEAPEEPKRRPIREVVAEIAADLPDVRPLPPEAMSRSSIYRDRG